MDCKRAGKKLRELALSGVMAADSPELSAHLAACSVCAEAFAREQEFVAAMNRGLAATVAGEPRPAFRVRVREQLAAPARCWECRWAVVAVVALVAMGISLRTLRSRRTQTAQDVSSPGVEIVAVSPIAPLASPAIATTTQQVVPRSHERAEHERVVLTNLPPVLIEKGEREATLRFLKAVRSGGVDTTSLLAEPESGEIVALQIAPIEIVPLNIPPLAEIAPGRSDESAH
jgi:hypothetical protein